MILAELAAGDFVGVEREIARTARSSAADAELLLRVPRIRGGPEVLEGLDGPLHDAGHRACATSTRCSARQWPSG